MRHPKMCTRRLLQLHLAVVACVALRGKPQPLLYCQAKLLEYNVPIR